MKRRLKDENDYPLNFNPSNFYTNPEKYIPMCTVYEYKDFPEYYMITTWGRVYNTKTGKYVPKILIPERNRYIRIILRNNYNQEINMSVHTIVANSFIPFVRIPQNGESICVNHIDGIKWHNEPYNLEWVSLSENTIHADQNNLIERPYGEDNGASVLTDNQYRQICELTQQGYMTYQVNKIMNLGIDITNIVQKIRNGKSETLISKDYDFSNIPRNDYRKFSEDQVHYICSCLQDHPEMKYIDIIKSLGYDINNMEDFQIKKLRDTISTIKRRVSYIEIGNNYNF